jgi:hypothetical protein
VTDAAREILRLDPTTLQFCADLARNAARHIRPRDGAALTVLAEEIEAIGDRPVDAPAERPAKEQRPIVPGVVGETGATATAESDVG